MIMTVRRFIETMGKDIDVYNNVTDDEGVAYCPPMFFTKEGNEEFGDVLNYKIDVDEDNQCAEVICDDEEERISWQTKKKKAERLFWSMAGYCSEEDYDKWFTEQSDYFEAVEVCPYCDSENTYPMREVNKYGYIAECQHCGKRIFLCDECMHSEDNPTMSCNWHMEDNENVCMRGRIKED